MKKSIGSKIFTIAIGLVLLMAAGTFISSYYLNRVDNEVRLVSSYYIPLDQHMGEVRVYGLYELIQFDRFTDMKPKQLFDDAPGQTKQLIKDIGGCAANTRSQMMAKMRARFADAVQRRRMMFELMEQCGQEEMDRAAALIEQALANPAVMKDPEQAIKFTRIKEEMDDIPPARKQLYDTLLAYFSEMSRGDKHSIELMSQQVDRDWINFAKQINDVTLAHLHPYSQEAASKAADMEQRALYLSLTITAIAGFLGLVLAAWLTRNLVRPVRELLMGTKAIEHGHLDIHIKVSSSDEIATLADSFNHMVGELRQKENITETFGKYVDPRIVKVLLEDQHFSQRGEKRVMTVYFSDLEGFTALSEKFSAENVVGLLNQYFTLMSESIRDSHGIIDKYIGDAIMAYWGPPFTAASEHPLLACKTALRQRELLKEFETRLPTLLGLRRDLPKFNIRVGISTGEVIVGSIGSDVAKSYTVIGDNVNLASRLESANKNYGTNILVGEEVWKMVRDTIECREIDSLRVAGKIEPVRVFEPLAEREKLDPAMGRLRDHFEAGLAAYRACQWDEAEREFKQCMEITPQDQPSATFLARIAKFRETPPPADWDGIWTFTGK